MPLLFCGLIVIVDQAVKFIVKASMVPGESIPVVPHIFHITYVLNPGAAFGILENQRGFFIASGVVAMVAAGYFLSRFKGESAWLRYGMLGLLGGAIGNFIDRLQNGLVVDFFDFRVWPVFNIADIAIVGGVASIVLAILFRRERRPGQCKRP